LVRRPENYSFFKGTPVALEASRRGVFGDGRSSLKVGRFELSAEVSFTTTTALTLYGAGVSGGGVVSNVYPAGGVKPTARLFYAELLKRF
jgi:hypothetical protein